MVLLVKLCQMHLDLLLFRQISTQCEPCWADYNYSANIGLGRFDTLKDKGVSLFCHTQIWQC